MWNRIYYSCTNRSVRRRLESQTALRLFIAFLLCVVFLAVEWRNHKRAAHHHQQQIKAPKVDQILDMPLQEQQKVVLRKPIEQDDVPAAAIAKPVEQKAVLAEAKAAIVRKKNKRRQVICGSHTAASCADCPQGHGAGWCNGECRWENDECVDRPSHVHPDYHMLLKEYPFQPVATDRGEFVNIICVRAPFSSKRQKDLYLKYKDDILFLGISSFESFPLSSPNPFSSNFSNDEYRGLFPGKSGVVVLSALQFYCLILSLPARNRLSYHDAPPRGILFAQYKVYTFVSI